MDSSSPAQCVDAAKHRCACVEGCATPIKSAHAIDVAARGRPDKLWITVWIERRSLVDNGGDKRRWPLSCGAKPFSVISFGARDNSGWIARRGPVATAARPRVASSQRPIGGQLLGSHHVDRGGARCLRNWEYSLEIDGSSYSHDPHFSNTWMQSQADISMRSTSHSRCISVPPGA